MPLLVVIIPEQSIISPGVDTHNGFEPIQGP